MLIDGKKIAQNILEKLKVKAASLPFKPVFCDVLVGNDPVSVQYVEMKAKAAANLGLKFLRADFHFGIQTQSLAAGIKKISQEPNLCGLIVQLPLPEYLNQEEILNGIPLEIDVDVMSKEASRMFYENKAGAMIFPTAAAVMEILDSLGLDFSQKQILVIGQGMLVGRPVSFLLKQRGFHLTTAHSGTRDLPDLIKKADVVISAAGRPGLIFGDIIKPGAVVIDAGASESGGGVVGDVDFESAAKRASFFSPVPGGVGPVTVAKLLQNVLIAAERKIKSKIGLMHSPPFPLP